MIWCVLRAKLWTPNDPHVIVWSAIRHRSNHMQAINRTWYAFCWFAHSPLWLESKWPTNFQCKPSVLHTTLSIDNNCHFSDTVRTIEQAIDSRRQQSSINIFVYFSFRILGQIWYVSQTPWVVCVNDTHTHRQGKADLWLRIGLITITNLTVWSIKWQENF